MSSLTRRELARRRPGRSAPRHPVLMMLVLLAVLACAAFLALHGAA